jgi:hypothetical protein
VLLSRLFYFLSFIKVNLSLFVIKPHAKVNPTHFRALSPSEEASDTLGWLDVVHGLSGPSGKEKNLCPIPENRTPDLPNSCHSLSHSGSFYLLCSFFLLTLFLIILSTTVFFFVHLHVSLYILHLLFYLLPHLSSFSLMPRSAFPQQYYMSSPTDTHRLCLSSTLLRVFSY